MTNIQLEMDILRVKAVQFVNSKKTDEKYIKENFYNSKFHKVVKFAKSRQYYLVKFIYLNMLYYSIESENKLKKLQDDEDIIILDIVKC